MFKRMFKRMSLVSLTPDNPAGGEERLEFCFFKRPLFKWLHHCCLKYITIYPTALGKLPKPLARKS